MIILKIEISFCLTLTPTKQWFDILINLHTVKIYFQRVSWKQHSWVRADSDTDEEQDLYFEQKKLDSNGHVRSQKESDSQTKDRFLCQSYKHKI